MLFYHRNESKDEHGVAKPITDSNAVLMNMNSIIWVSKRTILGGAHYSAFATLPFAGNDLTSDIHGNIIGGSGFADSYYVPFILGWNKERVSVRLLYGFLAPTGRYASDANNNVGSGYWTHAISSGQTFSFTGDKAWALSTFEMYEFHTMQEGTQTRPGQTFDIDYSLVRSFSFPKPPSVCRQESLATKLARPPPIPAPQSLPTLLATATPLNAIGIASQFSFHNQHLNLGFKYFDEFANRSSFQGYSLQFSTAVNF